ncbi:MAG TPA: GNAT family N-acetyltransferase, partial [Acetobacteraceae bacterium]|nr:GNAT family N-acetyltransferase [Acetobacteraceae bacterium]
TESDSADLAALHVTAWRESYAAILPAFYLAALSVAEREASWRAIIAAGDTGQGHPGVVLAMDEADSLLGFASSGPQRDEALAEAGFGGEIYALYVLQHAQRMGIGRALMARMFTHLADTGHKSASLMVFEANTPARLFYNHLGGVALQGTAKTFTLGGQTLSEIAIGWTSIAI